MCISCPGELAALILISQLLSGLASLHSADIAHRDVKLENVVVCNDAATMLNLLARCSREPEFYGATTRPLLKLCDFVLACLTPRRMPTYVVVRTLGQRDLRARAALRAK